MVKQSDRAPLLDWEEIPPPPDPSQAGPLQPPPLTEDAPPGKSSQAPGGTAPGPGWGTTTKTKDRSPSKAVTAVVASGDRSPGRPLTDPRGPGWTRPEPLGADRRVPFPGLSVRDQWEEKDQIVAVFVVTFDTRSGKQAEPQRFLSFIFEIPQIIPDRIYLFSNIQLLAGVIKITLNPI